MMRFCEILVFLGALVMNPVVSAQQSEVSSVGYSTSFQHSPLTDLIIPEVEPEEQIDLADALAAEGRQSLAAGDNETAARQLEVAYYLHRNAALLYPMGQAYFELGYYLAALERLEIYLRDHSGLSASDRAEAERLRARIQQQFAMVTITTEPVGARLRVDGRLVGSTPLDQPMIMTLGEHELLASLEGYTDSSTQLTIENGDPREILIRLEALTYTPPRGLSIGLWTTLGLSVASATVMTIALVLGGQKDNENVATDWPTTEMLESANSWWNTAYAMIAVASAFTVTTIVLAVLRARHRSRHDTR